MAKAQKARPRKKPRPLPPSSRKKTKRRPQPRKIDVFEVGQGGVLLRANFYHPRIREDVYNVSIRSMRSPEDLIFEMDSCQPLESEIYWYFVDFEDSLKRRLENAMMRPTHTRRIETLKAQLAALPDLTYKGARDWVNRLDERQFKSIVKHVAKWLRKRWDAGEEDYVERYTAQGSALNYFANVDSEVLGVKVIEGEHPGSTYYAAELRQPMEDANRAAEENGIPVRFVKASADTCKRYRWSRKLCGPRLPIRSE